MEKISFNNINKNSSVKNELNINQIQVFEKIGYINIKLQFKSIQELIIKNIWNLLITFGKIIFLSLILIAFFSKDKYFFNIYYGMKIYYKKDRNLNKSSIKQKIKYYKHFKISFNNQADFIKREKPKISLIIAVYNQENFLRYCYASIQKQELKDIEIIFIDDASKDNSSKIIQELMEKDKRIIYLKNKLNRRAFYSRNRGVLFSKGEYILIVDPDDLLLNNILYKAFKIAKYYNLDIVQYYALRGSYSKNKIWCKNKYKSGILYNEEVKDVFFYSVSRTLWDKLIKKEVFIKGIEFMKEEFHKIRYFLHNDDVIFWGIISSANSYGFLEEIGYFYNYENPDSTIHHYFDPKYMNDIFYSLFITLKYYYVQTKENYIEKNFVGYKFFNEKVYIFYQNATNSLTKTFDFIIEVLDMYINCSFFNEAQKYNLTNFKNIIIKRKIQSKQENY